MKRPLMLLSAALFTGALAIPVMAQENPPNTWYGQHHKYAEHFDKYFDAHPEVREALARNPRLIDDPHYLAQHPELQEYLRQHPRAAQAFEQHPDRFMHREHRYEISEHRWDAHHDHDHDGDAH